MAFTPFVFLDDNLSDAGDLVSVEMFQQIANNCNHLVDAMPVGSIVPIMVGVPGVPTPDPLIWHPCDGTEITNPNSTMHNTLAPDYTAADGRYMKGFVNAGTIGNYGGANNISLQHSHGGFTDNYTIEEDNGDTDTDFITVHQNHRHPLNNDLIGPYNFEPVHFRVLHYIKIF